MGAYPLMCATRDVRQEVIALLQPVFATEQSVRPGAGRRGTAFGGPVRSFSKVAPRPTAKDRCPRRPPQSAKE